MKVLKIDLDVPFWCSFGQYGTVNIQQTYPFPPPPTIFGMMLNAMGKPAPHTVDDEDAKKKISDEYLDIYSKLKFAIVIRDGGEKIDDYLNILKGNRDKNASRSSLRDSLSKEIKELKKKKIPENELEEKIKEHSSNFWKAQIEKYGLYRIDKKWMRTQINRQRLIQPKYTIYIHSEFSSGEYSLDTISLYLRKPKRPLYLGDSDSLVDVRVSGDGILEADEGCKSSNIASVIAGIHQNSNLAMIPVKLRWDVTSEQKILCSIPYSDIDEKIPCINVDGDSIVFLQNSGKK